MKIELHTGDKVLFAPIEDPEGEADFAKIIKVISLLFPINKFWPYVNLIYF
jgi:hypothetical protein